MHVLIHLAARRAQYDKFGEEGLKGGVPTGDGGTLRSSQMLVLKLHHSGFASGYVFHGDADAVFREFFGGNNPFAGECCISCSIDLHKHSLFFF